MRGVEDGEDGPDGGEGAGAELAADADGLGAGGERVRREGGGREGPERRDEEARTDQQPDGYWLRGTGLLQFNCHGGCKGNSRQIIYVD